MNKIGTDKDLPIMVEFYYAPGPVKVAAMSTQDIENKSMEAIDHSMNIIQQLSRKIVNTVDAITEDQRPSEATVSFGLKFTAEGTAIISKVGLEANINVELKWVRSK